MYFHGSLFCYLDYDIKSRHEPIGVRGGAEKCVHNHDHEHDHDHDQDHDHDHDRDHES